MEQLLQRRGYQDWVGEVDGYGSNLEIRLFAARDIDIQHLPENCFRKNAPARLHPLPAQQNPQGTHTRIKALQAFADAFKK